MFSRIASQTKTEEAKDIFAPVADLMVGVVFIFIVVMLALVLNLRNEETVPRSELEIIARRLEVETRLREASETRERNLTEANTRLLAFVRFVQENNLVRLVQGLADSEQSRTEILNEIRELLARSRIQVTVDPATGTLRLPAGQLFDPGEMTPTPAGRDLIRALARAMAQVLPCHDGLTSTRSPNCSPRRGTTRLSAVYIEGHTDIAPLNRASFPRDNWDLSAARAISAFQLIRNESELLRLLRNRDGEQLMGVSGYADTRPSSPAHRGQSNRPVDENDRRIEVRVIMATDEEFVASLLRDLNLRLGQLDDLLQSR